VILIPLDGPHAIRAERSFNALKSGVFDCPNSSCANESPTAAEQQQRLEF